MCTSTPGFSGHLGAAVGWTVVWVEWEDTVGLGGPPSGLCFASFFFFLRRVCLVNDKQSVTGDCSFARSLTFYAVSRYLIRDL